jgi:two-component system CheB/CheR fusion protein
MQHRVRNTLSVVRSLVRRTAEHAPSVEDFAAHLEGRIGALARGQSLAGATAGHGVDLELLINDEMLVHLANDDRLRVSGPPVRLRAKTAETLALAFHELATNAVKFGALSTDRGRIRVSWSLVEGPRLEVVWRESGAKVAAIAPRHRGFGMELLGQQLPYELDAECSIDFAPGGLVCCILIPYDDRLFVGRDAQGRGRPDA